jgi:hypothetical protein
MQNIDVIFVCRHNHHHILKGYEWKARRGSAPQESVWADPEDTPASDPTGRFTWADRTFYDGEWRDDKAHGQGEDGGWREG